MRIIFWTAWLTIPPALRISRMLGGSRSVHLLSFLVIIRFVPHGDLLCLLLGQCFSISMTVPGRCVYYVAVRMLFQPGQQADNVFSIAAIIWQIMFYLTAVFDCAAWSLLKCPYACTGHSASADSPVWDLFLLSSEIK